MTEHDQTRLADADDPRVLAFRALLAQTEQWNSRNHQEGAYEEAGSIVERTRNLLISSGVSEAFWHRFQADARACGNEDLPPTDAAAQASYEKAGPAGLCRGAARTLCDIGPAVMPIELAHLFVADFLGVATGEAPILASEIRPNHRQQDHGSILKDARERSILLAHFEASRQGSNWMDVHVGLFPRIGRRKTADGARKSRERWNTATAETQRALAQSAGLKTRKNEKLTAEEQTIVDKASRYDVAALGDLLWKAGRNVWKPVPPSNLAGV